MEYKSWLDLRGNDEHKAHLAKAAIALANEGGGVIVIGLRQEGPVRRDRSVPRRSPEPARHRIGGHRGQNDVPGADLPLAIVLPHRNQSSEIVARLTRRRVSDRTPQTQSP